MSAFDNFLGSVIPFHEQWKARIEPCASPFPEDDTGPCYKMPAGVRHLSDRDWHSTLQLLVFYAYIQIIVIIVAVIWDVSKDTVMKMLRITKRELKIENAIFNLIVVLSPAYGSVCMKRAPREHETTAAVVPLIHFRMRQDSLDVFLSISTCVTFIVRAYGVADKTTVFDVSIVNVIDITGACYFSLVYMYQWVQTESFKFKYVTSSIPMLNLLTITSALSVQSQADGWLPFTFLRSICMTAALHRLMRITDLPELYEQLFLSASDFFSMVFSFGGIIYILENLGNPAGWSDSGENFTFLRAIWFVMVTVSTVGYGDIYPVSIFGQIAGMLFIVLGVVFFGSRTQRIASLLNDAAAGLGRFSGGRHRRHIILSGEVNEVNFHDFAYEFYHPEHMHSTKSKVALCVLSKNMIDPEAAYVDDYVQSQVQFLVGSLPRDLDRVKIKDAAACFFLADDHAADLSVQTDREMLLRALKAKRRAKKLVRMDLPTYVGVLHPDSLQSAVGMTALCVSSLKTGLLAKSAACPGVIPLLANLLMCVDQKTKEDARVQAGGLLNDEYIIGLDCEVYKVKMPTTACNGRKYGDLAALLFEHGMTHPKNELETSTMILLGLGYNDSKGSGDGTEPAERILIYPPYDEIIKEEAYGYFIASEVPTERTLKAIFGENSAEHKQHVSFKDSQKKTRAADASTHDSSQQQQGTGGQADKGHNISKSSMDQSDVNHANQWRTKLRQMLNPLPDKLMPTWDKATSGRSGMDPHTVQFGHRVKLRDHIVVDDFVNALWTQQSEDRERQVLFLWDGEITDDQLSYMKDKEGVWLLKVPPLDPESLKKANVEECYTVLVLTERRGREWNEPGIIDSGVVFAHRFLSTLDDRPGGQSEDQRAVLRSLVAKGRVVCEINENANIDLMEQDLEDAAHLDDKTPFLRPMYAAGSIYSSSIVSALMVQAFYNPDILPLFGTLISSKISNTAVKVNATPGSPDGHERRVVLEQIKVPPQYCDHEYRELFHGLTNLGEGSKLPLGLYRLNCQVPNKDWKKFWYTYTNPDPRTILRSDDLLFVLSVATSKDQYKCGARQGPSKGHAVVMECPTCGSTPGVQQS